MYKGFSLIELLVVIAIVGILAAIAAPTYMNYSERAKLSGARQVIDGQVAKAITFYGKNGVFPTDNTDIGVASTFGAPPTTVNDYFAPYVALLSVNGHPQYVPGQCRFSFVSAMISNYSNSAFTISNTTAKSISYAVFIIDVNNVMVTKCTAFETDNGTPTERTDLMPGCYEGGNDMDALMQNVLDYVAAACD